MAAPFVFVDELIYTELARSLADTGQLCRPRDRRQRLQHPLPGAPGARRTAPSTTSSTRMRAAKATNAVVMSLAAIPTYLLARRVAGERLALLGAAIAVVVPSMAYTGTMTTESLFYPVALGLAFVLVRYLERPGWRLARGARRRARDRVRDALAVARLRAGDRDGAAPPGTAPVALVGPPPVRAALRARRGRRDRARRAPGRARPLAVPTCSAPTASWARAGTTSARCCGSGCGTSRSSTSTSGSCPSRRSCSR